ncbi:hypothetical protein ACFVJM_33485 [Streptomyces virginiae]|uniref:hypothetical protein n=1 Tax=Streptomyces virginiae TaxID=1961 RepID=UPI0036360E23
MTDDVREQLRRAAQQHRPDRARMLARVERGMAAAGGTPRRARTLGARFRVVFAAVAAAGVATAATVVVGAVAGLPGSAPAPPAAVSHSPTSAPPATAATRDADTPQSDAAVPSPGPSRTASAAATPTAADAPSSSASAPADQGRRPEDRWLWSDGSVDPRSSPSQSQSNVTLKTREPLTALRVELRIALTPGVKDTSHQQTRPADGFTATVREEGGFLVYRWVLQPGRTLPAGEHLFAGRYDHAGNGRDAGKDTYRAEATTGADTDEAVVWGDFAPVR